MTQISSGAYEIENLVDSRTKYPFDVGFNIWGAKSRVLTSRKVGADREGGDPSTRRLRLSSQKPLHSF